MKKLCFISFIIIFFLSILNCPTQDSGSGGGNNDDQIIYYGHLDTSFDTGTGPDNVINSIAIQSDGKLIIAGDFSSYNGTSIRRIARINPDGSLDLTFDPDNSVNGFIDKVAIQSDGKILLAGSFSSYNGTTRNNLARINSDGSLDASFDPGVGADSRVKTITIQSDEQLLIGGYFVNYNGISRRHIARINTDGSLDTSFNPGNGATSTVISILEQSDGKILIGGNFGGYNGNLRNCIARINTDGSLDVSFDPGNGANSFITSLALQSDGKIIIGGFFTSYDDIPINHIARINTAGSLDLSFDPGNGANDLINSLAILSDGKIVIGGNFTSYNDISRNHIARVNADGSLDTSFANGNGANENINSIIIQQDNKILIGGEFTSYNDTLINYIARISGD